MPAAALSTLPRVAVPPAAAPLLTAPDAVAAILDRPDAALDYTEAKLGFDEIVDPAFGATATAAELAHWARAALDMACPSSDSGAKLRALRILIYEPGPWNDCRPFAYDHDDPEGTKIENKLIANYLRTRRGNCVSMPILFLILGEALGLNVALATAPLHIFVRHRDEAGRTVNLETTSGALPARDLWYRQNMPMTDLALQSGIYMRSLGRREGVAMMAGVVLEHLLRHGYFAEAEAVGATILRHSPHDTYAMVKRGTACAEMIEREYGTKYRSPFLIPPFLRPRYAFLAETNRRCFATAEALGWEPVE